MDGQLVRFHLVVALAMIFGLLASGFFLLDLTRPGLYMLASTAGFFALGLFEGVTYLAMKLDDR